MRKIDNLSAIEGRVLVHKLFRNIRFERQHNIISTLFIMWKVCTSNSNIGSYTEQDITVLHKLGLLRGTILWLEEVINKFLFSTIQSFVYFGAAVLLILLGINKFYNTNESLVIYGIIFEVIILVLIFFIMLFSPSEDVDNLIDEDNQTEELEKELIHEIGEITKDFAITSAQLDKVTDHLITITTQQNELVNILNKLTQNISDITNPNPQMINIMNETNLKLYEFNSQIQNLVDITSQLKHEQIHSVVKQEIENFITNKIKV